MYCKKEFENQLSCMHTEAPALVVAAGVSISAVLVVRSLRRYARRQDLLRHWAKVSLVPHDTTQFLIRLATQPDAVLASVSSLSQLKHLIEALGQPPLLPREMHTLPVSSLAARAGGWVRVAATTIIVMQFNLLAEGLSSGPDAAPPFVAVRRSEYGGFDSVARPELALAWDTRKLRLLEEILRYAPDVLTVQECDHFDDLLLPALRLAGYDGVFAAKRSAPGLEYGFYSDGTAVFWRTAVFERLGAERRVFTEADGSDSSRPYLLVLLRHVARGTTLLVCSTHLKAKLSQERQLHPHMIHLLLYTHTAHRTRNTCTHVHVHAQCACACACATRECACMCMQRPARRASRRISRRRSRSRAPCRSRSCSPHSRGAPPPWPTACCCAATSTPTRTTYPPPTGCAHAACPQCCATRSGCARPTLCPRTRAANGGPHGRSAASTRLGTRPTIHSRKPLTRPCTLPLQVKHTIDYIFHDAGLRATRVLAPPQEAELEPGRLPGLRYPSDHLSIVAELEILS